MYIHVRAFNVHEAKIDALHNSAAQIGLFEICAVQIRLLQTQSTQILLVWYISSLRAS